MGFGGSVLLSLVLVLVVLQGYGLISSVDGYDPMDPNGNVTIKWDVMKANQDGSFDIRIFIFNYQLFRHIDAPGWKLSWDWQGKEVIWNMVGAEATEQGDCSKFKADNLPHCCLKKPVIVDLLPGAPYNKQSFNCCKGGVLSSLTQDPTKYASMFEMHIGNSPSGQQQKGDMQIPQNFSIGLPGYTCSAPFKVPPSRFQDGSRRFIQALKTWNVTCTYSQFIARTAPTCCVSLSAFYNETIVPCATCSCGCQGLSGEQCVEQGKTPSLLQLPHSDRDIVPDTVMCTKHMCPIRVHWHVKVSYKEYWRVKITVTNLNYAKNYSHWSLVAQHPNLQSLVEVFSFNYMPLNQYGPINDSGVFYGIQYYNDMLLQSGENGNVQTEILLRKDPGVFTFREGWVFPRKISFNGDECVMPPPDEFPRLPNKAHLHASVRQYTSTVLLMFSIILLIL
ncbi:hypothetical protein Scep_002886 [Stephania cephalantha]|uniref:COBRA-like protein n=1 Tax=Stephania cephalantha TaxID=152367 RepID=A0AAP0Q510_9MAGN